MTIEFQDSNFDKEVKQSKGLVLIDFWAPWCGPCKMQGPIVEELAKEFSQDEAIKIGKLNVDENQTTSQEFGVMSIPTLIIFKDGKVAEQLVGLQSKDALTKKIKEHLK